MTARVYLNGEYVDRSRACISIDDRGFLYGDALYENIRIYRGGFFRFREHVERLARGAAALKLDLPDPEELRRVAGTVVAANELRDGTARITLTRGSGGTGLATTGAGPPTVLVTAGSIDPARWQRAREGWEVIVARNRRSPVGLPASIKSANRLDAIMARLEADEARAEEAILLSADGYVAEGTTCNVFWRRDDTLCTPDSSVGILPGVTRKVVLDLAQELEIEVECGRFPVDDLLAAPEVFVTMTSLGPTRVRRLADVDRTRSSADVLPRIRDAYWDLVEAESQQDPIEDDAGRPAHDDRA